MFRMLLIVYSVNIFMYYFYASKIKHRVDPRVRFSKVAIWNKVDELRSEGVREAKIAYIFWVVANIVLALMAGLLFLKIGRL